MSGGSRLLRRISSASRPRAHAQAWILESLSFKSIVLPLPPGLVGLQREVESEMPFSFSHRLTSDRRLQSTKPLEETWGRAASRTHGRCNATRPRSNLRNVSRRR